jgi:ATP-dependent Clp protease protease subunit
MSKKIEEFNAEDRISVKLLENHTHFLIGEINTETINETIKWIVYENMDKKSEKLLTLYINSFGGDLYEALGLIDIMHNSIHPIRTIGLGSIMSAAFLIFASGTKGHRYIGKNTGIMCHQFSGNDGELKYHDIKAMIKENDRLNDRMVDVLTLATDLDINTIKKKLLQPSDVYLNAEEMVEYNAADYILETI